MEGKRRTGILVHGCHLFAKGWEEIVWGIPPTKLGRVPKGILIASLENANTVVFGTGASEKNGIREADITVEYMWEHFDQLSEFDEFAGYDLGQLRRMMERVCFIDNQSQNTAEEIKWAGQIFLDQGVERVVLVSSPTHICRCLLLAIDTFSGDEFASIRDVCAVPSDTSYAGYSVRDVVAFEPPHRGDLPAWPVHELVRRMPALFKKERMGEFLDELDDLLRKYED